MLFWYKRHLLRCSANSIDIDWYFVLVFPKPIEILLVATLYGFGITHTSRDFATSTLCEYELDMIKFLWTSVCQSPTFVWSVNQSYLPHLLYLLLPSAVALQLSWRLRARLWTTCCSHWPLLLPEFVSYITVASDQSLLIWSKIFIKKKTLDLTSCQMTKKQKYQKTDSRVISWSCPPIILLVSYFWSDGCRMVQKSMLARGVSICWLMRVSWQEN